MISNRIITLKIMRELQKLTQNNIITPETASEMALDFSNDGNVNKLLNNLYCNADISEKQNELVGNIVASIEQLGGMKKCLN